MINVNGWMDEIPLVGSYYRDLVNDSIKGGAGGIQQALDQLNGGTGRPKYSPTTSGPSAPNNVSALDLDHPGITNTSRAPAAVADTTLAASNADAAKARAEQQNTLNFLNSIATGKAPSAADIQAQRDMARSQALIKGAALSNQAGMAPGITNRNMLNAQAAAAQDISGQAQAGRAQERQGALALMGQLSTAMNNSSINQNLGQLQNQTNQNIAGLNAQTSLAIAELNNAIQRYQADIQLYGIEQANMMENAAATKRLYGQIFSAGAAAYTAGGSVGSTSGAPSTVSTTGAQYIKPRN